MNYKTKQIILLIIGIIFIIMSEYETNHIFRNILFIGGIIDISLSSTMICLWNYYQGYYPFQKN